MSKYEHLLIKDYTHWLVQVFENQNYLGRCVIWCKRKDAHELCDATDAEKAELFLILDELKEALNQAFAPDWFNYAFLGNEVPHLHCHFVPRYASSRDFAGIHFVDERWGAMYQTDRSFVTPPEILELIRVKLQDVLGT